MNIFNQVAKLLFSSIVFVSFTITSYAQVSSLPNGFPTNDASDGKMLVASEGLSSLGAAPADGTVFNVHIRVPISATQLNIELFDPDLFSGVVQPGFWDFPPLDLIPAYEDSTRFELYPDVDISGNTTTGLIKSLPADSSMDNQWIDFFEGSPATVDPTDPAACEQGPTAQFCFYHLVARWIDATTGVPKLNATTASGNVLNGFIVATNGQAFLAPGSTTGIMGMTDQSNAFPVPPTNYDGTFGLRALVNNPAGECALDIYDGDADRAGTVTGPIYPDESDDPNTPGDAVALGNFFPFPISAATVEEGINPGGPADNGLVNSIGEPIGYTVSPEPPTAPYGVDCCVNDNPSGDKEWELFRIASTAPGCPDVTDPNYDPDDESGSGGVNGPAPVAAPDHIVNFIGPGFHNLIVGGMDANNLNFLNITNAAVFSGEAFDFGDAPDTYQTTISNNGPSHDIDARLSLGVELDAEVDGVPSVAADGDDISLIDDEDGVSSFDEITTDLAGGNYNVEVAVRNELDPGNAATLLGWIDFDNDETFEVTESASAPVNPGDTTATLSFVVPGNISAGNTYARFRLTSDPSISTTTPGGGASDGEVEDYPLIIGDGGEECIPCKGMEKLTLEMSDWGGSRDANEIVRVRVGDLLGGFSGNDFNAPVLFQGQVPNGGTIEINVPEIHLGKTLTISVEGNNHQTEFGKLIIEPDCDLQLNEKSGTNYIEFKVIDFEKNSDQICECNNESENGEFCPPEPGEGEGCTPGYWKQPHHFDSWVGYDPADLFRDAFGKGPLHSLLFSLSNGGGGSIAFRRHATAALLNAASPDVDYFKTEAEVIQSVNDTFTLVWNTPKAERKALWIAAKNVFRAENEKGCPLN